MTDQTPSIQIVEEGQTLWHTNRQPAGCSRCRRAYLAHPDYQGATCPICRQGTLEAQPALMRLADPEQVLPFQITMQALLPTYQRFVSGVWIKPEDFNPETLLNNTRPVFWPLWLVDSDVSGRWHMQAGFDYQVESAKEVYVGGRWESRNQIEKRVRWEPRAGQLETRIQNVVTPALEEHANREIMTGKYQHDRALPYDPDLLGSAFLELPDLPPEVAWPLARPDFDQALANLCQKAAGAQHQRDFAIDAQFERQNWTELFLPMYATHYTDDEGQPQVVIINGETGEIRGPRLASRKRGSRIAGIIGGVAGFMFTLTLIGLLLTMVFPPAAIIAVLCGILGLSLGILAIVIAVWPGQWNRTQNGPRITDRS